MKRLIVPSSLQTSAHLRTEPGSRTNLACDMVPNKESVPGFCCKDYFTSCGLPVIDTVLLLNLASPT
jgi:hypothetical protein